MELLRDLVNYEFLRNALITVVLSSILSGTVSPVIVYKRMEFIGDGLAHAIFAGVALAVLLDFNVLLGAILATVLFAFLIYQLNKGRFISESTAIGLLLPVFMSIGVVLFSKTERYTTDVTSYLFGNLLLVTKQDILFILVTTVATVLILYTLRYEIAYWIFDEEMANFYGINVKRIKLLVFVLISFTVVATLKVAGVVVMGAFLVIPGVFAKFNTRSFTHAIEKSTIFNISNSILGFLAAYYLDLPPGPTIVLLSFASLMLSLVSRRR
ncbi:metal ABC transporter permease [Fervidobacterium thailandense]|uniref:Metal ABC transporter permease n=1 Tax=Fervidobacterium thailandense TaxID=1008305 RepID=A0A1E3G2R3_9BACT|nr:metal ABC transporter permease [Fervidobacterium thailandense]ODN30153.1 metal ABC transporter permease [Fervidobacterium thailandense]